MEEKPLLQYYTDETWGYDIWDEESKKREGVSVKFQQEEDETREDFFKRLGFEPNANMYGSDWERDEAVRSRHWFIRASAAHQGHGLDILVHDESEWVRCEVALQGYSLDIFVRDVAWRVRRVVAEQGFGLDILVNDEHWEVRKTVASQGFGLDVLVHDEDWRIRCRVASQGYGLDVLINDEDWWVRHEVENCLKKHDYPSVEAWIEDKPKKVADKKNKK